LTTERNKALVSYFTVIPLNTWVTLPIARVSINMYMTSTAGNTSLDTHKYRVVSYRTFGASLHINNNSTLE